MCATARISGSRGSIPHELSVHRRDQSDPRDRRIHLRHDRLQRPAAQRRHDADQHLSRARGERRPTSNSRWTSCRPRCRIARPSPSSSNGSPILSTPQRVRSTPLRHYIGGAFQPTAGGADSWRVSDVTLATAGLIPVPPTRRRSRSLWRHAFRPVHRALPPGDQGAWAQGRALSLPRRRSTRKALGADIPMRPIFPAPRAARSRAFWARRPRRCSRATRRI